MVVRSWLILALCAVVWLASASAAVAKDGVVATPITELSDQFLDTAVQGDGKIVAVGYETPSVFDEEMVVVRYTATGELDPSFDGDSGTGNGIVTVHIPGSAADPDTGGLAFDEARAVVIEPDGKIVIAGVTTQGANGHEIALARLNPDGTLDSGFGSDGVVVTPFGDEPEIFDLARQSDGKLVVSGETYIGSPRFGVARYIADGSLDTSFDGDSGNGNGLVSIPQVSGPYHGGRLAIQGDGKLVVAGSTYKDGEDQNFAAVRLKGSDGTLDTSFGGDGRVDYPVSTNEDVATGVAIAPDGKLVLGGWASGAGGFEFALARLNGADGSLDNSFDGDSGSGNGVVTTDFPGGGGSDGAFDVAIQADGKIVLAGQTAPEGTDYDIALARYNGADGTLDTTFDGDAGDGNGRVTLRLGVLSEALSVLALTSTSIVGVGYTEGDHSNQDGLLVRLLQAGGVRDSSLVGDTVPPETTIVSGPAGSTTDRAARFEFTGSEVGSTFECSLDGAAFSYCGSPWTLDGLAVGTHTFRVRATDANGNIDPTPAERTWTVDTDGSGSGGSGGSHSGAGGDSRVVLRVSAHKRQKLARRVAVFVRCPEEACTVAARGRIVARSKSSRVFRTRKIVRSLPANKRVRLRINLSCSARRAARHALRRHKRVTVTITVVAQDAAGNTVTKKLRVRLKS